MPGIIAGLIAGLLLSRDAAFPVMAQRQR